MWLTHEKRNLPPHKLAEHRRSRGPRYEEEYMKARWKKRDPLPGRGGASLYLETDRWARRGDPDSKSGDSRRQCVWLAAGKGIPLPAFVRSVSTVVDPVQPWSLPGAVVALRDGLQCRMQAGMGAVKGREGNRTLLLVCLGLGWRRLRSGEGISALLVHPLRTLIRSSGTITSGDFSAYRKLCFY